MAEHCITQVLSHGMTVRLIESPDCLQPLPA